MDSVRRNKLIMRWALVSAGLTAIFWGGWYLANGSVPIATEVIPGWTLPFFLSRWWDVLAAPVWSTILILIFINQDTLEYLYRYLNFGVFAGMKLGPITGLFYGLHYGLTHGLASGLILGLVFALILGLILAIFLGIVSGLFEGLFQGLNALFSSLNYSATYKKILNFLTAED